jgi:16S rRNA processing protein RimM
MGRILAPYGVKGWVKVEAYSTDPEALAAYPVWWVGKNGQWKQMQLAESVLHSGKLAARLAGCEERNAALALKGSELAVRRDAFPPNAENEFYLADLVGLEVVNSRGEALGAVAGIFEHGAHPVIRVVAGDTERLLPFVEQVVRRVDMAGGRIQVEWELDW